MEKFDAVISNLQGWSSLQKCRSLYSLVVTHGLQLTVEVGLYGGKGGMSLAFAHKEVGGMCFGIDPYSPEAATEGTDLDINKEWWGTKVPFETIYRDLMIQVLAQDLTPQLNVLRMKSDMAVTLFKDETVDLVIIDGNHTAEVAGNDFAIWSPKIKVGGFMLVDDMTWQGVAETVGILEHYGFKQIEYVEDPAGSHWAIYQKMETPKGE